MNNNIIGYDAQTGQPIYANQNNNTISTDNKNLNNSKNGSKLNIILYIMISILVLLIVAIGIVVVSKNNGTTRTFMIYMVGSDLESKSSMGTYELDGIDPTLVDLKNINVVLIAGGSSTWGNDYIDEDETSIYQLTKNGFEKVKQQKIKNMGDYSTLSDFINFVTKNYITDEYELLFWNHGGAIMGSEFDELSDNDNLSLQEIQKALTKTQFNKNNKIETVIFSTCLNGTIENANVFKDYANYFVASEEISMSVKDTSDFSFINYVTPKTESLAIGRSFIEKYKEKMNYLKDAYQIYNKDYNIYSTYSIVDLNNLDDLNKSVDDFFAEIDVLKNYNKIARVRSNLYQYAYKQAGEPSYDTVDLYNLINDLKELSPKKANKVLEELENTIIYNYSTDSSSRGMSIYFPYNASTQVQNMFLNMYNEISPIRNYNKFIDDFSSFKLTNSSNRLSFKNNSSNVNREENNTDFELELTDEQVENYAKANYLVFRDNKNGTYQPIYKGNEVTLEGNKIRAKFKDRQLKIVSNENNYEGVFTLFEEENTDGYIKYSTIVTLEDIGSDDIGKWRFDVATVSLMLDKQKNKVSISGVLLSNKEDLPSKVMVDLKDYTHIIFSSTSYKILDENGNYTEDWDNNGTSEGHEFRTDEDYEFKINDFADDYDYYCVFRIYDVNNNYYYSNLVKMK